MEEERFKIYVDQLREGRVEQLSESFDPAFIGVEEPELSFTGSVEVSGEAYLAEDELILHLDIAVGALVPCKVCGATVLSPVKLRSHYEVVPKEQWLSGIFSMRDLLREVILLEAPSFAECRGDCPERETLGRYLAKEEGGKEPSPFDTLHIEDFPEG